MDTTPIMRSRIVILAAMLHVPLSAFGQGGLTLANPHWNITLTAFRYSDFLLDNTPASTPGQLVFTWPDTPNWMLTESSDLATWKNSTRPVTNTGGQNSVTVTPSEGRVFFRLSYQ